MLGHVRLRPTQQGRGNARPVRPTNVPSVLTIQVLGRLEARMVRHTVDRIREESKKPRSAFVLGITASRRFAPSAPYTECPC